MNNIHSTTFNVDDFKSYLDITSNDDRVTIKISKFDKETEVESISMDLNKDQAIHISEVLKEISL